MSQKKRMNATKKADALFGKWIRSRGVCQLRHMRPETECSGALQVCHIFSRRYRSIRWASANARCGCQAHHLYFTLRPAEWEQACRDAGIDWDALRMAALWGAPEDPNDVIERLKDSA